MNAKQDQDWEDTVLPFQLDKADMRGRAARLGACLDNVLAQHDYPPEIQALVAETVLLTALIGQTIKLKWKLSLQVRGDGPARLIATDFFAPEAAGRPARIRAWASFDRDRIDPGATPFSLIGKGYFALLLDQGDGAMPYSGMTPIVGASLSDCAAAYFAQSEQLPTAFALSFGQSYEPGRGEKWRAGGLMVQHVPKASPLMAGAEPTGSDGLFAAEDLLQEEAAENWKRVGLHLQSAEALELIGPKTDLPGLLYRLFHEESPRIFPVQKVEFGCPCSAERVVRSLSIYSAKDIAHMTTPEGTVTADCQFCGAHYVFDPADLGIEAAERSRARANAGK
ncbi:MAG TPA: Hsp33 family molecular chaperone HslO [Aliiroseovarius sp.]|nr:Hsp33 family molecular chaperone HslO [Aliiroseovarius sp.]